MSPSIPLSRQQADQLLRWLKGFRALGGAVAMNDLQCYLCQCLRALVLKDQGFEARVRGQRQHWFLVVEGGRRSTIQPRSRTFSGQRRLYLLRSRNTLSHQ